MATQSQMKQPDTGNSYIAEIADFMFATKSLEKISKGQGSWGDLVSVGITAASFVVLPAKITMLSAKALGAVIKASSKVVASDAASVAAKRAASRTLDDALTMKRQGYIPTGKEPVERVGRAGLGEPTPAYQVTERTVPTSAAKAEKGMVEKKYTRTSDEDYNYYERDITPQQAAEDAIAGGRMSYKAAPEAGTPKGSAEELRTKYVSNPKSTKEQKERALLDEARKTDMYDKTKYTQDEIDDLVSQLSKEEKTLLKRKQGESKEAYNARVEDYVRSGSMGEGKGAALEYTSVPVRPGFRAPTDSSSPVEFVLRKVRSGEYTDEEIQISIDALTKFNARTVEADAKEVADLYLAFRRVLKDEKINKRLSPEDLKSIKSSFGELKKEFKDKVVETARGKAILKTYEREMPGQSFTPKGDIKPTESLVKYEENIADNAKPGDVKSFADVVDESPITTTAINRSSIKGVPVRAKLKRIPEDLQYGVKMPTQRAASLLVEKDKLTTFNKTNSIRMRKADEKEIARLKESTAENNKKIKQLDAELKKLKDKLSNEDQGKAAEIAAEITKRELAALKAMKNPKGEKYLGDNPPKIKKIVPSKSGDSTKYRGNVERLRQEEAKVRALAKQEEEVLRLKNRIESLRRKWKKIPKEEFERRSAVQQRAKQLQTKLDQLMKDN